LLEDTGIKLSAVASDIMGVSGRAMLEALIRGEADPHTLADLAKRSLRHKIPELTEALTERFREHHAFLARLHLDQYDQLTGRVEEAMAPFRGALDLLDTIPGINRATAEVIVAETGGDMARFATAKHLASTKAGATATATATATGEVGAAEFLVGGVVRRGAPR
jgi:transposase